jgi:hypothetical protein
MNVQGNAAGRFLSACARVQPFVPGVQSSLRACKLIVEKFPKNTNEEEILLKAVVINSLLGTAIRDVVRIASHIMGISELDARIERGDCSIIDALRQGHGIHRPKTTGDRDLYSFATKYAHFHNPAVFPIFDDNVANALKKLNAHCKFTRLTKADETLRDYEILKATVDKLKEYAQAQATGYQQVDAALWLYGKYLKNEIESDLYRSVEKAEGEFLSTVLPR